jgi:hypothetical protein
MTIDDTSEHLDEVSKYCTLFFKDNNSDDNQRTKKLFVEFAWSESNGNYFQALKRLLENYSIDYKYASLYEAIELIKADVALLESSLQKPVDDKKEEPKFYN